MATEEPSDVCHEKFGEAVEISEVRRQERELPGGEREAALPLSAGREDGRRYFEGQIDGEGGPGEVVRGPLSDPKGERVRA